MSRRGLLLSGIVLALAIWAVTTWFGGLTRRIQGEGVLYGHLWCMGIALDSGEAHPIHQWPAGLTVPSGPLSEDRVVLDEQGQLRFTEGQRVVIEGLLVHGGGDTPCANTNSLSVSRIELAN